MDILNIDAVRNFLGEVSPVQFNMPDLLLNSMHAFIYCLAGNDLRVT